jgi:hypothetical protein
MPVRVPRASLAPQLRNRGQATWEQEAPADPGIDERAPEATRDMLAQMQQGWKRGRLDDVDDADGAAPYGIDW